MAPKFWCSGRFVTSSVVKTARSDSDVLSLRENPFGHFVSRSQTGGSWCCLYFLLGLFVFSLISRRFIFPISNVFVCNFPEVVCNLNRDSRIGTLKYEKEKNAPRRRQRSKMFVYQNEEKNAREADGALCRPRRTRPRPGRIAELVVNMYYV